MHGIPWSIWLFTQRNEPNNTMKKKISISFILLATCLLFSCSEKPRNDEPAPRVPEQPREPGTGIIDNKILAAPKASFDTLKDGDYTSRYENGVIQMKGYYKNGKREGEWAAFFPSGQIQSEGFFTAGKRDHKAVVYYDNGNKMYEGLYKDGFQVGIWKFYERDGKLKEEVNYDKKK